MEWEINQTSFLPDNEGILHKSASEFFLSTEHIPITNQLITLCDKIFFSKITPKLVVKYPLKTVFDLITTVRLCFSNFLKKN